VLFPGQTLPLHIFEPRYRIMIQRCVEANEPFGVVLAVGEEPDHPAEVGTSARVTEIKRLPDGRLNILTIGEERFKLHNFRVSEDGYLIGDVSAFPFDESVAPGQDITESVAQRLSRYLKLLAAANGMQFRFDQFPTSPMDIAVFAAIALRLPLQVKQDLLAQDSLDVLLRIEADVLGEELRMLKIVSTAVRPPEDDHIFSRN
jgi:Lon protease-like protein